MIQTLIFDLDDTLYQEKDFVTSGYRAVANYISAAHGCEFESIFDTMMNTWARQGKEMVFPVLIDRFPNSSIPLAKLVEVYRKHSPTIFLSSGYLELLRALGCNHRLGIITDGLPQVQQRKVRALGLENVIDKIIYTWDRGSDRGKPHPHPFSLMLQSLRAKPESSLFIGDDLQKDCRGAHAVGMKCVLIRDFESSRKQFGATEGEPPEFIIDSLLQLPPIIQQINQDERN